ncbi:MAG: hypothetical protein AB8U25_04650 [Rickettsiales endosymbiont of Dermacentor nuttalli]
MPNYSVTALDTLYVEQAINCSPLLNSASVAIEGIAVALLSF